MGREGDSPNALFASRLGMGREVVRLTRETSDVITARSMGYTILRRFVHHTKRKIGDINHKKIKTRAKCGRGAFLGPS